MHLPYNLIRRPDGGIVFAFHGVVTPEENMRARLEAVEGDFKNLAKIRYMIADHTKTETITHKAVDIIQLAKTGKKTLKENNPDLVIAMVGPKDLIFGMARMFDVYFEPDKDLGLFRSMEEAEIWVQKKLAEKSNPNPDED